MNRPLNGLVHIQSFSEDIEFEKFYDEENEKWHILFQIWRTDQIKKKMISGKLNIEQPTRTFILKGTSISALSMCMAHCMGYRGYQIRV